MIKGYLGSNYGVKTIKGQHTVDEVYELEGKKLGFKLETTKKFHKYYSNKLFQCWQLADCHEDIRNKCPAYLNYEYRFWKVTNCKLEKDVQSIIKEKLENVIELEDA